MNLKWIPACAGMTMFVRVFVMCYLFFMRVILTIFLFILSSPSSASGWHDYTLDIGDGYKIFRANSFDISLSTYNRGIIVSHHDFSEVGPITEYFKNSEFIFLKTAGWTARNLFEGDQYKDVDYSRHFYFVVEVPSAKVVGPFSLEDFGARPEVQKVGDFEWVYPQNPNFWTPLIGNLMFLGYMLLPLIVIGIFAWWFVALGLWVFRRFKKRA